MNRNIWMLILAFATGTGVGFLIGRKVLEEKYAELAQEEIDSVKENFKMREMSRSTCSCSEDGCACEGPADTEDYAKQPINIVGQSSLNGTRTNEYENAKRNYSLVGANDRPYVPAGGGSFYKEAVDETDDEPYSPYVITEESFSEDFIQTHEKVTLTYYAGDNTLVNEDESLIDDVDGIVGCENLGMMHTTPEHPHTIYVRNERLGADYEILINLNTYQEMVMGVRPDYADLSPREIQARRMRG